MDATNKLILWNFYLFLDFIFKTELHTFATEARLTDYHWFLDRSQLKCTLAQSVLSTDYFKNLLEFKRVLRTLSWLDYSQVVQVWSGQRVQMTKLVSRWGDCGVKNLIFSEFTFEFPNWNTLMASIIENGRFISIINAIISHELQSLIKG